MTFADRTAATRRDIEQADQTFLPEFLSHREHSFSFIARRESLRGIPIDSGLGSAIPGVGAQISLRALTGSLTRKEAEIPPRRSDRRFSASGTPARIPGNPSL